MLKNVPPIINPRLLWILSSMGHGDDLALVDRNFPAHAVADATVTGEVVHLDGVNATEAARDILSLLPLDTFVETPVVRMEVVGDPAAVLDVHEEMQRVVELAEGRPVALGTAERHAFYAAARRAYAVVQTTEDRPYGCFLLKKGVIFD